jgi:phenylacetic acid degradation operon negative regulatory protein
MSQDRKTVKKTADAPPLTARSVLLSTLLGTTPPVLPARVLVRAGELFGISEGSVRTALSRMAAGGEVRPEDGSYRLAGRLLERQARQQASRAARTTAWRPAANRWRFAFVVGDRRTAADRADLRAVMRAVRMAELREGVWLRPDNLAWTPPPAVAAQCLTAVGRPDTDPTDLARLLWDLDGWADDAAELRKELAASSGAVKAGDAAALAPGFVLSAAVLRHFQADPLLPAALLPPGWPGDRLRAEYADWDRAYRALLRIWLQA